MASTELEYTRKFPLGKKEVGWFLDRLGVPVPRAVAGIAFAGMWGDAVQWHRQMVVGEQCFEREGGSRRGNSSCAEEEGGRRRETKGGCRNADKASHLGRERTGQRQSASGGMNSFEAPQDGLNRAPGVRIRGGAGTKGEELDGAMVGRRGPQGASRAAGKRALLDVDGRGEKVRSEHADDWREWTGNDEEQGGDMREGLAVERGWMRRGDEEEGQGEERECSPVDGGTASASATAAERCEIRKIDQARRENAHKHPTSGINLKNAGKYKKKPSIRWPQKSPRNAQALKGQAGREGRFDSGVSSFGSTGGGATHTAVTNVVVMLRAQLDSELARMKEEEGELWMEEEREVHEVWDVFTDVLKAMQDKHVDEVRRMWERGRRAACALIDGATAL